MAGTGRRGRQHDRMARQHIVRQQVEEAAQAQGSCVHPWPVHRSYRTIVPVFLPFAGCTKRCIYCAQNLQTARGSCDVPLVLEQARQMLEARREKGLAPCELAFYGGTFTAQEAAQLDLCLASAKGFLQEGLIDSWRCSTRPDSIPQNVLDRLRKAGCRCVELGIQSLDAEVLARAGRTYEPSEALDAIAAIRRTDMACGVQLLPGLPGADPERLPVEISLCADAGAQFFRFYPCLVVESTPLAKMYRDGQYEPWSLETTVSMLAEALLTAHARSLPVIRIGVAYEESFEAHVLAGIRDPLLGTRVRAEALLRLVQRCHEISPDFRRIFLPLAVQGCLYGVGGANRARLERLGIVPEKIVWVADDGTPVTNRVVITR